MSSEYLTGGGNTADFHWVVTSRRFARLSAFVRLPAGGCSHLNGCPGSVRRRGPSVTPPNFDNVRSAILLSLSFQAVGAPLTVRAYVCFHAAVAQKQTVRYRPNAVIRT